MITFLVSLCVVTRSERAWRASQHGAATESWLSSWFGEKSPYQVQHDSTWQDASGDCGGSGEVHGNVPVPAVDTVKWFTRKKHRKMAKLQIGDAFALQNRVAAVVIASAFVSLLGTVWALHRLLYWLSGAQLPW